MLKKNNFHLKIFVAASKHKKYPSLALIEHHTVLEVPSSNQSNNNNKYQNTNIPPCNFQKQRTKSVKKIKLSPFPEQELGRRIYQILFAPPKNYEQSLLAEILSQLVLQGL